MELHRHNILTKQMPDKVSWASIADSSIGFMQRPYNQSHLAIAKLIKQQCPLWVDFDDCLLDVSESNPGYELYSRPEVRDAIHGILDIADVVTVSTKGVADSLGKGIVIPNAYNQYKLQTSWNPWENKVVLWRGTATHAEDLLGAKKYIDIATFENPDVKFVFFGFNPWMLAKRNNIYYIPEQDIFSYHQTLNIIKPSIVIAPLEDNTLNRGKSNIAWLETARFGSTCLAPEFEEWDRPGIGLFSYRLTSFVEHSVPVQEASWNHIKENLFLSEVNRKRLEIIDEIS